MKDLVFVLLPTITAFLWQVALAEKSTTCGCGWVNKGRMVGGHDTKKNEFPWMAALYDTIYKEVNCGAAIITRYHLLSAGHCAPELKRSGVVLLVGLYDVRNNQSAIRVPIEKGIVHPTFNTSTVLSDDILVIITMTPIPFSSIVGPVCMPTMRINLENQMVKATGWGQEGFRLEKSNILKEIDINVITRKKCLEYCPLTERPSQLCVMEEGKGPCVGDSGGPWVWFDPEIRRYTLVGITSYGGECVYPPPAVETEVAAYLPWIKEIIKENKPENLCTKA